MAILSNNLPFWLKTKLDRQLEDAKRSLELAQQEAEEKFAGEETTVRIQRLTNNFKKVTGCNAVPRRRTD